MTTQTGGYAHTTTTTTTTTTITGSTMAATMARAASHDPSRSADGTPVYGHSRRSSATTGLEREASASSSIRPTSPLLSPHSSTLAARRASSRSARLSQAMYNDGFYTPSYISTAAAAAAVAASSPSRQTPLGAMSSSSQGFPSPSAISPSSQQQHFPLPIRQPQGETNLFPVDVDEDDFDFDAYGGIEEAKGAPINAAATQNERMYPVSQLHVEEAHATQRLSALSLESQEAANYEELQTLPNQSVSHGSATDSSLYSPPSNSQQRRHRRQRTQSTANSSCSEGSHSSMDSEGSVSVAEIKQATTRRAASHDTIGGGNSMTQRVTNVRSAPSISNSDSGRITAPAISYHHGATAPPIESVDMRANPSRQRIAQTGPPAANQLHSHSSRERMAQPSGSTPPAHESRGGRRKSSSSSNSSGHNFVSSLLFRRRSNSNNSSGSNGSSAALPCRPPSADRAQHIVVNQHAGTHTQTLSPSHVVVVGPTAATAPASWSSAPVGHMPRPRDDVVREQQQQQQSPTGNGPLSLLQRRARKISGSMQRIGQGGVRPRSSSGGTNDSVAHADMASAAAADIDNGGGGDSSSSAHSPSAAAPLRTRRSLLTLASLHNNAASPRAASMSISPPTNVTSIPMPSADSMASQTDVTSEILRASDAAAYSGPLPQRTAVLAHSVSDAHRDLWTQSTTTGTPKERGDSDVTITRASQSAAPNDGQSASPTSQHQIRRKPVVPLSAYPPSSPSSRRAPVSPQGPGKVARVRLSSAAPISAAPDDGSASGGVLIPSNFGSPSSSSLATPRSPSYLSPNDATPTSQIEMLGDAGRQRTLVQPQPPPRARRSGSMSRQRSGSRASSDGAHTGSSAPARNPSASPLYAYTSTERIDARLQPSTMESRQAPSPVAGTSFQPPSGSSAGWTGYQQNNTSNESAATPGGGGSRMRAGVQSDVRLLNHASTDSNTYSVAPRTGSSQGHKSTTTTTTTGSSWMASPAAKHESLSRQSWVGSSAGGHEALEGGLQTTLNEEDIEVVEQDRIVTDTSDLYQIRRRIAMEVVNLGAKRLGSSRPLSSRSSRTNVDADLDSEEHEQRTSPAPDSMLFVGTEKERRKRREALEARERELSVEALSKAEMAYAHIEVWTESRKGKWIVGGPASDDADVSTSLPDVPSPWAVPIDAKGIVRRKKLKSNVELSSSRTVMTCQDCREVAAMNIAHNCKTCAGSERVEMAYTVQCTVRHAHFLPLKLPAALLMGVKQPHIAYLDAADSEHRSDMLRDRAIDGLQSSAARVVRAHNAQHGSRLLMGRVTIARCGLLSVSVKSSKNKSRRLFDVEDGVDGKVVEVTPASAAAASARPSSGRASAASMNDGIDAIASDATSVRSSARTEYGGGGVGGTSGGLLHRGKKKSLAFNRSSPNLHQDARLQTSPAPLMPGAAGSNTESARQLGGHQRTLSDDQTSAVSQSNAGREMGKRSLKSFFR